MNKKLKILIFLTIVVFLSLVAFSFYYRYTKEKETIAGLNQRSQNFIEEWGNYSNSSDSNYLNSLKPYLSDTEYRAIEEEASTIREYINDGYEPNISKVTVKNCSTEKKSDGYKSVCDISQEIVDYKKSDLKMNIFWKKLDDTYLINNWYTE